MKDEGTDKTVIISEVRLPPRDADHHICLVVVAGHSVGQVFGIDRSQTIGRGEDADVRLEDIGMSRTHARLVLDQERVAIEDLQSTNGTWVNGIRVEGRRLLSDGDKLQFGTSTVLRFEYQDKTDQAFQRRMFESASRDGLTGALNTRYFLERLTVDVEHALRRKRHLSLLLLDIDHFKQINDTHGHLAGDIVLRDVAEVLAGAVRRDDAFARYGGEEFVVLARATDLVTARALAEHLRRSVEEYRFDGGGRLLRVTTSVGVASLDLSGRQAATGLLEAADAALYRAKAAGRNRVEADV